MNNSILNTEVQSFIDKNLRNPIDKIILKGSPFNDVTIQELANQIVAKQKAEKKLPKWFNCNHIYYPPKISIEQTSSEKTAQYKSTLVQGNSLVDITGGFGVDAYYFAKQFNTVTHCEINNDLSTIVKHNFEHLKISNIETVATDGLEFLKQTPKKFDCIYIDPSRRHNQKGKVFLLKDCMPNVPDNLDFLFTKTDTILIKNSPILDITATINELHFVKEIHIVALKNDVKELLFLLEKDYDGDISIITINNSNDNHTKIFTLNYNSAVNSEYSKPLNYLYEPNAAILKSGGFHDISVQLNVKKLQQHTHLYTSDNLIEFPGRSFSIIAVIPYNKKQLLKTLQSKKANITTRNFPKSVAQLRKETKLSDGGDTYLFFCKLLDLKNAVIICKKT